MSDQTVRYLVGESFHRSTCHPDVQTVDQLVEELRTDAPPMLIRPGLGLDIATWEWVKQQAAQKATSGQVAFDGSPAVPVARRVVLKHASDNVVIGNASTDGDRFRCELVIANDSELMRDHTADQQHVPGMLLIEAAIQAITWAVAKLTTPLPGQGDRYAVMHACEFAFHRFAFPLPAVLEGQLEPNGKPEDERIPLKSTVTIWQVGRQCSTLTVRLDAFDPSHIFAVEHAQARKTLDRI
ncbi:AfsA-related hotdog domain-containing protein [Streptomyces sp. NPDC020883]|uniref:AfsA-related hotdog domain-containing protein n=1 Tax=Streptomyces sp. NPDC020883 TaxID=3365099 RepID=UPI003794E0F0